LRRRHLNLIPPQHRKHLQFFAALQWHGPGRFGLSLVPNDMMCGPQAALIDGTATADLTVTGLARTLPYSWTEQERLIGLSAP